MRTFRLEKLVRKGVFESMQALGQKVVYRVLGHKDHQVRLVDKIIEEAREFDPERPENDELVDILQAYDDLAIARGTTLEALRKLQLERKSAVGGFEEAIFVETVGVPDGDEWADYYAKEPDRFPEE